MKTIKGMHKVAPEHRCDVCANCLAPYYNITYYIHICSKKCWEKFLKRYNIEINSIALEITNANDLQEKRNQEK